MDSINEQIKKLSIGNKSYTSSSETSSSSRESLSSISSLANSSENIAKLRNTINRTNLEVQDISYSSRKYPASSRSHTASREDIYKQQSEQERRRQHEVMLHKMANQPKGTKPKHVQQSQRRPLFTGFDCDDDDSDDFDGFSEDEYC
ncbi:hypothetical protein K502DRAFT_323366 [Neoconidiobolus thromboides FSU 785]|nr:hypothetical protein K502DRAFT_323366 [Neoconidiobolus thromboides FSU 785]